MSNQGCAEICSEGKNCSNRIKIVIDSISEKFDPIEKLGMYHMNFLSAESVEVPISPIT